MHAKKHTVEQYGSNCSSDGLCVCQACSSTSIVRVLWPTTLGLRARLCKVLMKDGRTLLKGRLAQKVHAGLNVRLAV